MKLHKLFLVPCLLLASIAVSSAQELETGYFLGGNPYAYRMNPAFQSERSTFSIALGETGLGLWSNLGVSTLLYPGNDGKLYTFMNDRVSSQEFLKKIHRRNAIDADVNINVLALGIWSRRSFVTVEINARSINSISYPYDVFSFLKDGTTAKNSFDFSGTAMRSKTFAELAVGWSHNYDNVFNVGFRVKGLVGALETEALMKKLTLSLNEERWEVKAQGELNMSSPTLAYKTDENGDLDFNSIGFFNDKYGPAGYGAAVDLGVSWNILPLLTLSAAVLDFGAIRWNREIRGKTPDVSYVWNPSEKEAIDPSSSGGQDAVSREMDEILDNLSGLVRFQDAGSGKAAFDFLPFRVNLGAEYRMPFYDRLSVGALYMGRGGSAFGRHTARLSLNWNPLNFLSLSTGTTLNKLGESIGFALNLHPAGVNLMIGCDYIPFRCVNVAPLIPDLPAQYSRFAVIPANRMNLNLYLGLNLAFGRRHVDHARRFIERPVEETD